MSDPTVPRDIPIQLSHGTAPRHCPLGQPLSAESFGTNGTLGTGGTEAGRLTGVGYAGWCDVTGRSKPFPGAVADSLVRTLGTMDEPTPDAVKRTGESIRRRPQHSRRQS
jgi:hypothetical protein